MMLKISLNETISPHRCGGRKFITLKYINILIIYTDISIVLYIFKYIYYINTLLHKTYCELNANFTVTYVGTYCICC